MAQYIDKSALVTEIEKREYIYKRHRLFSRKDECDEILSFIDTLEVKDANEALRTEYEKGRADVIADTISWLANVWPQYCNNPNIIDAYKEGVVKD